MKIVEGLKPSWIDPDVGKFAVEKRRWLSQARDSKSVKNNKQNESNANEYFYNLKL